MSGTHFTLDRDRINPMVTHKDKACKECGTVKPNTFEFFNKKLWRSRTECTTTDVCKVCKGAKVSKAFAKRREDDRAYEQHKFKLHLEQIAAGVREREEREAREKSLLDRQNGDPGRK